MEKKQMWYIDEKGTKWYRLKPDPNNPLRYIPLYYEDLGTDYNWDPQTNVNVVEIFEERQIYNGEQFITDMNNELNLPWQEQFPITEKELDEKVKEEMGLQENNQSDLELKQLELIENQLGEYHVNGLKTLQKENEEYQNSINHTTDEQGKDRKAREIQAHEQKHSTLEKEKYIDSIGEEKSIKKGYYANKDIETKKDIEIHLDKFSENESEVLNNEYNQSDFIYQDEIVNIDYNNFTSEEKEYEYITLTSLLLSGEITYEEYELRVSQLA